MTRRQLLRGATASLGLPGAPPIVRRSTADAVDFAPPPLRGEEILPSSDFSLLQATNPYRVGIRLHQEGGDCLKLDDELITKPATDPSF
jgi:hypothetical protein